MKKLTVLIPVYNREELVGYTLAALVNQTFKDFKVLVVDDGSTDNTLNEVERFKDRLDMEIIVLKENKGVNYCRQLLVDSCDTEYMIWQDSDDISHPERLDIMLNAMRESDFDVMFSHFYFFRHPNMKRRSEKRIDISRYTSIQGLDSNMGFGTGIFRRTVLKYKFNTQWRKPGGDYRWLCKLIESGEFKFGLVPQFLYYLRRHEGRLTNQRKRH